MFDAIDQFKDEDGKISLEELKLKFEDEDEDGNFKRPAATKCGGLAIARKDEEFQSSLIPLFINTIKYAK